MPIPFVGHIYADGATKIQKRLWPRCEPGTWTIDIVKRPDTAIVSRFCLWAVTTMIERTDLMVASFKVRSSS